MAVDTVHPLYNYNLPIWQRNTDAVMGEQAIKRRTTRYLPIPNPAETIDVNDPRYQSYLTRAVFTNFTGRTVRAYERSRGIIPADTTDEDIDTEVAEASPLR